MYDTNRKPLRRSLNPFVGLVASAALLLGAAVGCDRDEEALQVVPFPAVEPPGPTVLETEGGGGAGGEGGQGGAPEAPKPKPGNYVDPIGACCAALHQNAKSAPLAVRGYYVAAAGTCDTLRKSPDARAALARIRAQLRTAKIPNPCR